MVTPAPPPAAGLPRSERVQHRGPRRESEKSRSEICRGRARGAGGVDRNVGKSVGFVFVLFCFVFPATCRVLRPRREPHTPPGAGALTVKSARTTQSLQLPRREPTCPHPRAEPLRLDVDGGQLSSPAATSRNGSAEVLRSENGRRERTKALGCSPAPLPDVPLGRLPRASINPPHLSPSGLQVQDVLPRSVGQKGNYYIILDRKTEGWFPLINSKTQTDKAWGSRVEKGAECLRLDRKANHVCPSLISSQGYSVSRKLWKHSGSLIDHSSCFIKYAVMLALPAKYDKMKSPMALPRKAENQQSTIN
ncbi:uncharacterized protein LOC132509002 [Lagenorhynchus albirostris]|uniref:uncharacterized protein LOC132509002 n=1 Tax=Lagenorhynchus albirostris TaxID=27610 RepID=UPI0028EBF660|nr:uncharacterized protein LOC132509002 [Lagenorhynchus albirostris]